MQGRAESGDCEDDGLAKQIESQVIDDMYKSTIEQIKTRRERYMTGLEEGKTSAGRPGMDADSHASTQVASQGYKSYLEECRREYKQEKDEKIRNKSFEFDRSLKNGISTSSPHELGLSNSSTNILPAGLTSERMPPKPMTSVYPDSTSGQFGASGRSPGLTSAGLGNKESTVNIRQEIKNKSGLGLNSPLDHCRSLSPKGGLDPLRIQDYAGKVGATGANGLSEANYRGDAAGTEARTGWTQDGFKSDPYRQKSDWKIQVP